MIPEIRGILFSGPMYSGKDSVCNWLKDRVINRKVQRFAWADPLKMEVANFIRPFTSTVFGIENINKNKVELRPMLCAWADYRRNEDPDYWVKASLAEIDREEYMWALLKYAPPILWVNTDTRYRNELAFIDKNFICIRLTVSREKQEQRMIERDGKLDLTVLDHPHESELQLKYLDTANLCELNGVYRVDSDKPLKDVYRDVEAILAQHQVYTLRTLPNE